VPGEGTFVYTYNNLNQVETITSPNNDIYTYNYDDAGRRTGITYPNGKEISYTYDEYGRVETYNNGIKNVTYIYEGNNIKEVETAKGNIVYDYDELDRLTGVSYPDGEIIKYDYDSAGNRTSKIILNKTDDGQEEVVEELIYTYDFSDRLTQVGEIRYEYDDKDRLIKKIDGDNTFDYIYNSFDQLIIVKKNGVEIASFEYDLIGRRISENINGERKEYLWAGGSLLGEYINGSLDRLYAVGNGIDEVLGIYDNSGQKEYIHSNHIGSITGVSDLDGNIVGEKEYTPFGLRRNVSGDVDTDLSFIGRKYYNEIGLTYIRARFYDPAVGRFITKDPVRDGFNWYSYCNGNPVGFVDNNGLKPIETIIDNFKLDWAGIKLLNHYLHKSPQSMIIKNDPQWSKYMMDSDNIKNYVLKKLKNINKYWGDNQITSKISILYDPQKNNKKNLQINNTGSGNGATGYDFLCGVEDFYMSGTAIKKGNRIHYNLQFNWVDTIDTKEDNFHDNKKNRVAFVYCFWNMKYVSDDTLFAVATGNGYPIEIEWNSRPIYDLNSEGGTGWPYK
ncbi:MAG: RHS repeat domain-containing protein, partial [bacterium]